MRKTIGKKPYKPRENSYTALQAKKDAAASVLWMPGDDDDFGLWFYFIKPIFDVYNYRVINPFVDVSFTDYCIHTLIFINVTILIRIECTY